MVPSLESVAELVAAVGTRSSTAAGAWCSDWLRRRDAVADQLAAEDLAAVLESLAGELAQESATVADGRSPGLTVAASYLLDAATDTAAGADTDTGGGAGGDARQPSWEQAGTAHVCDWTGCNDRPRWLLQTWSAPQGLDGPARADLEISYCHAHLTAVMKDHAAALLTTAAHVTIHRTR